MILDKTGSFNEVHLDNLTHFTAATRQLNAPITASHQNIPRQQFAPTNTRAKHSYPSIPTTPRTESNHLDTDILTSPAPFIRPSSSLLCATSVHRSQIQYLAPPVHLGQLVRQTSRRFGTVSARPQKVDAEVTPLLNLKPSFVLRE